MDYHNKVMIELKHLALEGDGKAIAEIEDRGYDAEAVMERPDSEFV